MPSSYTAKITAATNLRAFGLLCARAFGATISMRDEPLDTPIPERFEPSGYHLRMIEDIDRRAANLRAMTDTEVAESAREDHDGRVEQAELRRKADAMTRANYQRVLDQVQTWSPPPELSNFRTFMLQQLAESMRFDCPEGRQVDSPAKKAPAPQEWRDDQLARLAEDLRYHQNAHAEEVARTEERNAWISLLRSSLPEE